MQALLTVMLVLILAGCGRPAASIDEGTGGSTLASIDVTLPAELPLADQIDGYRLVIEPITCDAGITGTHVDLVKGTTEKITSDDVVRTKVTQACDYKVRLSLGALAEATKTLATVFFTNTDAPTTVTRSDLSTGKAAVEVLLSGTAAARAAGFDDGLGGDADLSIGVKIKQSPFATSP